MQPLLFSLLLISTSFTLILSAAAPAVGSEAAPLDERCYAAFREPRFCEPTFENIAFGAPVVVSSQCGKNGDVVTKVCTKKASDFVDYYYDDPGDLDSGSGQDDVFKLDADGNRRCGICNASTSERSFGPNALTDADDPEKPTFWISAKTTEEVEVTLNLGKAFEVAYVAITFCNDEEIMNGTSDEQILTPTSFDILKSIDERNFEDFHYFRPDCLDSNAHIHPLRTTIASGDAEDRPLCSAVSPQQHRVAYVTLDGRPSAARYHQSVVLQQWVKVNALKVVLRHEDGRSGRFCIRDVSVGGRCLCNGHASRCVRNEQRNNRLECACQHGTAGLDCQQCQEFYNDAPWTRALPAHLLLAANSTSPVVGCRMCQCNGHSTTCRFDDEIYRASNGVGGGVCRDCAHHTTGRRCQFCLDGFYRDFTRPVNHPEACAACDCHQIGAFGESCDQTTGACRCKEGVTGRRCDTCAVGYRQTASAVVPCVRIVDPTPTPRTLVNDGEAFNLRIDDTVGRTQQLRRSQHQSPVIARNRNRGRTAAGVDNNEVVDCDASCRKRTRKVDQLKWCRAQRVVVGRVFDVRHRVARRSRATNATTLWTRYSYKTVHLWKDDVMARLTKARRDANAVDDSTGFDDDDGIKTEFLWTPSADVKCKCPRIRVGKLQLLVGKYSDDFEDDRQNTAATLTSPERIAGSFVVSESSDGAAVTWHHRRRASTRTAKWNRRLTAFLNRERSGRCRKLLEAAAEPAEVPSNASGNQNRENTNAKRDLAPKMSNPVKPRLDTSSVDVDNTGTLYRQPYGIFDKLMANRVF